jgi:4-amino-4-deoxy-L-arabinose transferase-like glycosyltransferase
MSQSAVMTAPQDELWTRRVLWLLAGLFVLRVGYLAICPLELCPDEAYYWDWSRQLDWGYYSKPPMIAWLIGFSTRLGGHSEFVIRLPAACLGTLGLWPVFALGRRMFDARVGFWAAAAVAATPGLAAMSLLMTIDAPFLCAWAFAVWCVWELLSGPGINPRWLTGAILATGLGLLSKQTMFGIFPLVLLWLATSGSDRHKLKSPTVWTWIAGSLLFLTPVVWWNRQHGWITAQHTSEHFQSRTVGVGQHAVWFLEFWASQFGVLSPISGGLIILLSLAGLGSWKRLDGRVRFLLCLSAVPMLGVSGLSALQRVQPNWPAAFHLAAFVLLAAWGCGAIDRLSRWEPGRRWFPRGVAIGAVLVVLVYLVPFVVPTSPLAGGPLDATARLRGWRALGHSVGAELAAAGHPQKTLMIAATGRGPVSALAYYIPGKPCVYRWNGSGIVESQHEVWGGVTGHDGWEALVVTHGGMDVPPELAAAFDQITLGPLVQATLGPTRIERLQVWRGYGFRRWPDPRRREVPCAAPAESADPGEPLVATPRIAPTTAETRIQPAAARR